MRNMGMDVQQDYSRLWVLSQFREKLIFGQTDFKVISSSHLVSDEAFMDVESRLQVQVKCV